MRTIRVFPRKTNMTPDDELAYVGWPPLLFPPEADEVLVSVAFRQDMRAAEALGRAWSKVAPVKIGGPAFDDPGGEFVPGKFVKAGVVITSRGCPNHCFFCSVWKREPKLIELPIHDGYIIQDDNLLACSESHIRAVFAMLKKQKEKARLSGGLEARLLRSWHVELLADLKPHTIFFAYDMPEDYEPLVAASKLMRAAGFNHRKMMSYCLVGFPGDSMPAAEKRVRQLLDLDIAPFVMVYQDEKGKSDRGWRKFQKFYCRPSSTMARYRQGLI